MKEKFENCVREYMPAHTTTRTTESGVTVIDRETGGEITINFEKKLIFGANVRDDIRVMLEILARTL